MTSVTQFNAIFVTQKCRVLRFIKHGVFHLFLKHGEQISVEVTGKRRNKGTGLEISATHSFYHKKPSKVKMLIEVIRDKYDRAEVN